MELRQLETFRAVAEERSFSRAAARLGYVQSSVSSQVGALERELGVPLFDRLGRSIALTGAGRVMFGYSERMLTLAEEARRATTDTGTKSGEITGKLIVSAPETLLTYRLPRLLARFHERYPKAQVEIRPSPVGRLAGDVRHGLERARVDVAFVLDEPTVEGGKLTVESLIEEEITIIASPSHALAKSKRVAPRDLADETVLLPEAPGPGCAYRGIFERQLAHAGASPIESVEFASIETIKRCVMAGMGVSVLPNVAVESELRAGQLAALGWNEDFSVSTLMAWHGERWESAILEVFLEEARALFGQGQC